MVNTTRKQIGIIFNFKGSWLGGVYYLQNIIKSLAFLEENRQPIVYIFFTNELAKQANEIKYPHLKLIPTEFPNIYSGYLKSYIFGENYFIKNIVDTYDLDGIYPLYDNPIRLSKKKFPGVIATWFPDLQHKFYPNYFTKLNLYLREFRLKLMLKNVDILVVSSNNVASHFKDLYRLKKDLKLQVLPFVSIIDQNQLNSFDELEKIYELPDEYYLVSNQFYEHKNHKTLFEALDLLNKNGKKVNVVLTGIMEDYRNPEYISNLKGIIEERGLASNLFFLGLIPREHQLTLLKFSKAVIQPSLFEGWSTIIEDAKTLNVPVIYSDIEVHKEQLGNAGICFDSKNPEDLAKAISSFDPQAIKLSYTPYEKRVTDFAQNFLSIFN